MMDADLYYPVGCALDCKLKFLVRTVAELAKQSVFRSCCIKISVGTHYARNFYQLLGSDSVAVNKLDELSVSGYRRNAGISALGVMSLQR